jgi:hypothetical protein
MAIGRSGPSRMTSSGVKRDRPWMCSPVAAEKVPGLRRPFAVLRPARRLEADRADIPQAAGQEVGTAHHQDAEQSEPQDECDPSVRPAGDGMGEGEWQPAQR